MGLALMLGMTLGLPNRDNGPGTRVSEGVKDVDIELPTETGANPTDQGVDPTDGTGSATGPSQPSNGDGTTPESSSGEPIKVDVRKLLFDAITSCPQTNPADLSNKSMMQMEVFEELAYELEQMIVEDDDGQIDCLGGDDGDQ